MANLLKKICAVLLLVAGLTSARAFVIGGPIANGPDAYQTTTLTYNQPGDVLAPKNLGEEFRWNIPVLFYSFDQAFLDYYGNEGALAVDRAFAIYNKEITNVSTYSTDLSEISRETRQPNFEAQALHLYDLTTATMELIATHLGLGEPDRWTWALRDRTSVGPCPAFTYFVIRRNWDPITFEPSSYVNGTLLNYHIDEFCPTPNRAEAREVRNDGLAVEFGSVAEGDALLPLNWGFYYTGLTRDDVAGLRYLWRSNNVNIESAGTGVIQIFTNTTAQPTLLTTLNLAQLVTDSFTNDAPTLTALYPGLVIAGSSSYFTLAVTTNTVAYFINQPAAPAGAPATLVTYQTFTTNLVTRYTHQFANVVTNHIYTNGVIAEVLINTNSCPGAPAGYLCPPKTNLTSTVVPMLMGDYYLIPTNSCGISFVGGPLWSNVVAFTNVVALATNASSVSNLNGQQFSRTLITFYTNYQYAVRPVLCLSNSVALRQGMEKIRFVRRDFDSEFNQFFYPTNLSYTGVAITNNAPVTQLFQRLVITPDILITAADLSGGGANGINFRAARTAINFNTANVLPGLAGPGTIESGMVFQFNKVGQIYNNSSPSFLEGEIPGQLDYQWASFDGSTNPIVLYPSSRSLAALENQMFIQINPSGPLTNGVVQLPDATVNVNYAGAFAGFSGTGGQPPYYWEVVPGSPGLPGNMVLNSNGTITGAPANGTAGVTYDILVRMTDAAARFVDRPYAIKINP